MMINKMWKKIKSYITERAYTEIGTKKVNINERKNKEPWFTIELKVLAKQNKNAYKI